MTTIKVLINGVLGRMGQEAKKAVSNDPYLELVGECDLNDNLATEIKKCGAQVVVDFTVASASYKNTKTILESGVFPVIGTSGLSKSQVDELKLIAKNNNVGGVIAPNFAIGAVLMMKFATQAGKYFNNVEIIEMHHNKKADAPSGTAVKSAEMIAQSRQKNPDFIDEIELIAGARGATLDQIPIHSIRLPGMVAHQQVLFGGLSETLTIRHDSIHRESFMPGVCLACKKAPSLTELVYGLDLIL